MAILQRVALNNLQKQPGEVDSNTDLEADRKRIGEERASYLVVLGAWCVSFCSWGWVTSEECTLV